jgi:hypothetical protein
LIFSVGSAQQKFAGDPVNISETTDPPSPSCSLEIMLRYFASLSLSRTILWCYLVWYLVTVFYHFDATPAIWLNSPGIIAAIGLALMLSVGGQAPGAAGRWQSFRLFLLPFCVSSFSSLIKNKGVHSHLPTRSERTGGIDRCLRGFHPVDSSHSSVPSRPVRETAWLNQRQNRTRGETRRHPSARRPDDE